MNLDLIAQMSCILLSARGQGHLVREVDALAASWSEVADAVAFSSAAHTFRGSRVWSPRAQCDKQLYRVKMREVLESQPGLHIRQAEVVDLVIEQETGTGNREQTRNSASCLAPFARVAASWV